MAKCTVSLAGVIGGLNSGIQENPVQKYSAWIFACWDAEAQYSVKTAARAKTLCTDASQRFEKYLDPALTSLAILNLSSRNFKNF